MLTCTGVFYRAKVLLLSVALSISRCSHFKVVLTHFTMASNTVKHSGRRQGLAPEEDGLGVCLICQDDFSVEELQRLRRTECCRTLFHRRCFREMIECTSICTACRFEMQPKNPRTLELPEDDSLEVFVGDLEAEERFAVMGTGTFATSQFQSTLLEDIHEYYRGGLPAPHIPSSAFWPILPYFIPEHYIFTYLTAIKSFSQMYVGRTLYLHGFVCIPISVAVCQRMYEIFLADMP